MLKPKNWCPNLRQGRKFTTLKPEFRAGKCNARNDWKSLGVLRGFANLVCTFFFLEFQSFSETWIVFILISLGHGASAITSTPRVSPDRVFGLMRWMRIWERSKDRSVGTGVTAQPKVQSQRKAASSSNAQDHLVLNCFSSWTLSSERGFSSTAKSNVFPSQGCRLKKDKQSWAALLTCGHSWKPSPCPFWFLSPKRWQVVTLLFHCVFFWD